MCASTPGRPSAWLTPATVTGPARLAAIVAKVRELGWALAPGSISDGYGQGVVP
ncbi:hypothetical protein [Actinophytocola sp.]|uniref:hypothetical protein n=1 Tax=Actinophytocola sp. TaxID=1872138 RepID=UPI002ED935E5